MESGLQDSIDDVAVIKLKPRRKDTEGLRRRRAIVSMYLDLMKRRLGNEEINLETNSSKQNTLG